MVNPVNPVNPVSPNPFLPNPDYDLDDYIKNKNESDRQQEEQMLRNRYANQESLVASHYNSCTTTGYRANINGNQQGGMNIQTGSISANTQLLNMFRSAQKELKNIRMEAQRKGVNITPSYLETVTVNVY